MIEAVENNDLDTIVEMLNNGTNINEQYGFGWTALMEACSDDNIEIAKCLLQRRADPNIISVDGDTALMIAVRGGNLDITKLLLEKGALINVQDNRGTTPLMFAVTNNDLDIVKYLIQHGSDVNIKDKNSNTALILSMKKSVSFDITKYLIQQGANVTYKRCQNILDIFYYEYKKDYERNSDNDDDIDKIKYLKQIMLVQKGIKSGREQSMLQRVSNKKNLPLNITDNIRKYLAFGKRKRKIRKISNKQKPIPSAVKKQAKKYKVKITRKLNGKRVYKKLSVIKKQIKQKKMKK